MQNYYHKETIDFYQRELIELLDLNFGKDWRVFLSLYYSKLFARHAFHYNNPHPVERTKFKRASWGRVVRDAIYSQAMKILSKYLEAGREVVEEDIKADKYRFCWNFEANKPKEIVISDELFNKVSRAVSDEQVKTTKIELKETDNMEKTNHKTQAESWAEELDRYSRLINNATYEWSLLEEKVNNGSATQEEQEQREKLLNQIKVWQKKYDDFNKLLESNREEKKYPR